MHAHGALAVATLVKRYHPHTPVIMGGLSASYFHRELIGYPQVDMVMRGDSTEESMALLLRVLTRGGSLENVPNLTWKDETGRSVENRRSAAPTDISEISLPSYPYVIRSVLRYGSLADVTPYADWDRYPMTGLLTSRGCALDCAICGGGRSAYRCTSERLRPAFRSPEALVRDLRTIQAFSRGPVILLNDLRMAGKAHTRRFFDLVKAAGIRNELVFELFFPADSEFYAAAANSLSRFSLQMSLESHDEGLRRRFGKFTRSNAEIEQSIADALRAGVNRVDLFFMVGIPGQTYQSAVQCVDYCRGLLERCHGDRRLQVFVAPLTPFLDPASPAFEHPEAHGYRVRWRTLEEHRQALTGPTWKHMLNYETTSMAAAEIVEATYECYDRLAELKRDFGRIDETAYRQVLARTAEAHAIITAMDEAVVLPEGNERRTRLEAARQRIRVLTQQKSAATEELKWTMRHSFRAPWSAAALVLELFGAEIARLLFRRLPRLFRALGPGAAREQSGRALREPAETPA